MDIFNQPNNLQQSFSKRWNTYAHDVLPLWVADMDFPLAQEIADGLCEYIAAFPLSYPTASREVNEILCRHADARYNWKIEPEWIVWLSGVVPGMRAAVRCFDACAKPVIIPAPIYPPFFQLTDAQNQVRAPVEWRNGNWRWNLPEASGKESMLFLCNPHNPTGKVFTKKELEYIGEYCAANDLLLCSDEIYADLVLDDTPHIPVASLNNDLAQRTITLMSAGKAWNISGMNTAFAVISDRVIREQFRAMQQGIDPGPSVLGIVATALAFERGEPWRLQLLEQLRSNRQRIDAAVAAIAGIRWQPNQATFLAWLECNMPSDKAYNLLLKSSLAVSNGALFGGDRHIRLNYGCSEERLQQALHILRAVFGDS